MLEWAELERVRAENVKVVLFCGGLGLRMRDVAEAEDLVEEPFQRLIGCEQLLAHRYQGFWTSMDTFKDRQRLQAVYAGGHPPWAVWLQSAAPAASPAA